MQRDRGKRDRELGKVTMQFAPVAVWILWVFWILSLTGLAEILYGRADELPAPALPVLQFAAASRELSVSEGAGLVRVDIVADRTFDKPIGIPLQLTAGAAEYRSDVILLPVALFPAGAKQTTVELRIVDDTKLDLNKSISVELSDCSLFALGPARNCNITIIDNDAEPLRPVIGLNAEPWTVMEKEAIESIPVHLTPGVTPNEIRYRIVHGDTDDGDLRGGAGRVAIASDNAAIPLELHDDRIYEGDESAIVKLLASPDLVIAQGELELHVRDDESPPRVSLRIPIAEASEALKNPIPLFAALDQRSASAVRVDYRLSPSTTARAGEDFEAPEDFQSSLTGTLTIDANTDEVATQFLLRDDKIHDGDKGIVFEIVSATVDIKDAQARLTVRDDEPEPTVGLKGSPSYDASVQEAERPLSLEFTLDVPTTKAVEINYALAKDCVAVPGEDFRPPSGFDSETRSGVLTIAPLATRASLIFDLRDDEEGEHTELFAVELTTATNANLSQTNRIWRWQIIDNDLKPGEMLLVVLATDDFLASQAEIGRPLAAFLTKQGQNVLGQKALIIGKDGAHVAWDPRLPSLPKLDKVVGLNPEPLDELFDSTVPAVKSATQIASKGKDLKVVLIYFNKFWAIEDLEKSDPPGVTALANVNLIWITDNREASPTLDAWFGKKWSRVFDGRFLETRLTEIYRAKNR